MLLLALAKVLDIRLKPRGSCGAVTCLCSERDQEVGGAAGPAHAVPPPVLCRPPLLIAHFAGPRTAGWTKDRIANRNCACFCLVKPKVLILFYELDVNDN